MVPLAEHPMMPRLEDERPGYFVIAQKRDYSNDQQRSLLREYITRFRLEKKDPSAAKSDPVKPIIYYIDPGMPEFLKPWARMPVLDCQVALDTAGVTSAIMPMDPPSEY